MREKPNKKGQIMEIKVGTKLKGDWGAMIPTSHGEVVLIEDGYIEVEWNDLGLSKYRIDEIHEPGWTSVNGSPIGIFLEKS